MTYLREVEELANEYKKSRKESRRYQLDLHKLKKKHDTMAPDLTGIDVDKIDAELDNKWFKEEITQGIPLSSPRSGSTLPVQGNILKEAKQYPNSKTPVDMLEKRFETTGTFGLKPQLISGKSPEVDVGEVKLPKLMMNAKHNEPALDSNPKGQGFAGRQVPQTTKAKHKFSHSMHLTQAAFK